MSGLSTVEVLRGAKAVLERNGWHQGWYYDQDQDGMPSECRVCVRGALNLAAGSDIPYATPDPAWTATKLLDKILRDRFAFPGSVEPWNDTEGRSVAQVYALLDEAIALAEGNAS